MLGVEVTTDNKEKFPKRYWVNDSNHHLDEECPNISDTKPAQGPLLWQESFKEYISAIEHTAIVKELERKLDVARAALEFTVKNTGHLYTCPKRDFNECNVGCDVKIKAQEALKEIGE